MRDDEVFDSLCRNAFEFLDKAIGEIELHPKYALINFAAALELLLKARLVLIGAMWIAEEPTEASAQRFAEGKLRTVGFELARQRIEALGGGTIDQQAVKAFRAVVRHRNRVIHFFHPEMSSTATRGKVATEIHVGWYFLHRLLSGVWENEFNRFQGDIARLGARLQALQPFLDAIYERIVKPNPASNSFTQCQVCGYQAIDAATGDRYIAAICRVCGFTAPSNKALQQGEEGFVASCMSCGGYQTAHRTAFGFRCEECRDTFSDATTCEYCGEHWVGAPDEYGDFYTGCEYCEGGGSGFRADD